ncbi:MAG: winged helix-turn-helix domain-containing protein [Candidatus Bathyarchaeota archaeon]|nr:winged helix-turn-helix domain-containing protein [Candidatus Termiticorpusculum sp.]
MKGNSGEPISKPDLYVLARVIKTLKEKNKMNKTALSISTGLSYDRLIKYLDWMAKKGFIEFDVNNDVVLTKLGAETYDQLVKWILQYVGKVRFQKI